MIFFNYLVKSIMGLFSRLGHKISHGYHRLGQKVHTAVQHHKRLLHKIGDVAGSVGKVAGYVSKGLAVAGAVAGATTIGAPLGAILEAGAGASRVLSRGAKVVSGGERLLEKV